MLHRLKWAARDSDLCLVLQYSDLELAINTLVTEFHKSADDAPTMSTTQFQTMISKQLPAVAKVQTVIQSQLSLVCLKPMISEVRGHANSPHHIHKRGTGD